MWISIYYSHQIQRGGEMISAEINVHGHLARKHKHSEVEVGIMDTNRKIFILTYGTPLMDEGHLHKYLGTGENTTSAEKLLS